MGRKRSLSNAVFRAIWNSARTLDEVAARSGYSAKYVSKKATALRGEGVILKDFRGETAAPDKPRPASPLTVGTVTVTVTTDLALAAGREGMTVGQYVHGAILARIAFDTVLGAHRNKVAMSAPSPKPSIQPALKATATATAPSNGFDAFLASL